MKPMKRYQKSLLFTALILLVPVPMLGLLSGMATASMQGNIPGISQPNGRSLLAPFTANGKILFTANRDSNKEIYTMDPGGANQTNITNNAASDNTASWSPDGTHIAFQSDRSGNNDIWVMRANGTGLRQLTTNSGSDRHPSWSPDGTQITFVSDRDGAFEIYKMNADGSNPTRLTNNAVIDDEPDWSPDGTKIAFERTTGGNNEIFVMNTDGSNQTNLTNAAGNDNNPDWSHDGTQIAFDTSRDGNFEVYKMNANGSGQTRLTNNAAADAQPGWSPDGTRIAFMSNRDGNNEIYTMTSTGGSQTRLTNNGADDNTPDWQDSAPTTPSPTPCAGSGTINGAITASDTPLSLRIVQNGVASSCGTNKPFPGSVSHAGHYDQYVFNNPTGSSQCVTVTLTGSGCGANRAVTSSAYLGSFDPNNMGATYRADVGRSINPGDPTGVYAFDVPAGQQFVVVVYDIGTTSDCPSYSIRVDGCVVSGPAPTSTPTRTNTPSNTPTNTPTRTNTSVPTNTPTNTPTPVPTQTQGGFTATPVPPSSTPTNTPTPTRTNTPTNTSTNIPTPTRTNTPLPTQTQGGPSATPIPTNTNTSTPINTATNTRTSTPTRTFTPPPTQTTGGPSATPVPSDTPIVPTATATPTSGSESTATPTACTLQFADVPSGSTFYSYVRCLACRGIINGYACGAAGEPCDPNYDPYFRPGNNVTRGQIAKIVSNSAGFSEPVSGQTFEDVAPGSTFYAFVGRLVSREAMSGYPCGGPGEPCGGGNLPYFRPNSTATRGQLAKIVSNAAGFSEPISGQSFEDVTPTSTFYQFIGRLYSRGAMNGYPCGGPGEPCGQSNLPYFRPNNNVTRGQTSKIVGNTFFPDCATPQGR